MAANVYSAPDRRHIVGSSVLIFVLAILTLGSLTGEARATRGAAPVLAAENAGGA